MFKFRRFFVYFFVDCVLFLYDSCSLTISRVEQGVKEFLGANSGIILKKVDITSENDVFLVRYNNEVFIAKVYNQSTASEQDIQNVINLLKQISSKEKCISLPQPIVSCSGQYIHRIEDYLLCVSRLVPGEHPSYFSEHEIYELLFALSDLFGGVNCKCINKKQLSFVVDELIIFVGKELQTFIDRNEVIYLLNVLNRIRRLNIENHLHKLIHFDVHVGNVLYDKESIGLIDFDDFIEASPIFEVPSLLRNLKYFDGDVTNIFYNYLRKIGIKFKLKRADIADLIIFDEIRIIRSRWKKCVADRNKRYELVISMFERINRRLQNSFRDKGKSDFHFTMHE